MKKNEIKREEDVINFLRDKTEFERAVLVATFKIPKGKISTYKGIAEKIGIVFMKVINLFFVGSLRKYRMIDPEIIANAMIEVANNKIDKQIIESDQIQKLGKLN